MAQFFTIRELIKSDTAQRMGLRNEPGETETQALNDLMNSVLDPIRRLYGKPIYVNSGYRSEEVNAAVGGSPTSQHKKGEAADITTGSPEENKRLFEMVRYSSIPYDQLIDEKNYSWLHVSYGPRNRRQILHL